MAGKRRDAVIARTAERAAAAEVARTARERLAAERAKAEDEARTRAKAQARAQGLLDEVVPYLRKLGFCAEEARTRASGACEYLPAGSLEERVRSAISGSYAPRAIQEAAA